MFQWRLPIRSLLGALALAAVLVPQAALAKAPGISVRSQVMRAASPPAGGPLTKQELPGCFNPSEPFAGASQCREISHPLYDIKIKYGDEARGPRQTTSLDASVNPETGALSIRGSSSPACHVAGTWGGDCSGATSGGVPERGPDLNADPTYNSALASVNGDMGYGWSFPYSMSVTVVNGVATITQENGSQVVFTKGIDGRFHAPPRVIASFKRNSDGTFTLTRGTSDRSCPSYEFRFCKRFTFSNGKVSRESTVDGSVTITRDGAGRPTSATADSGDSLTFSYTSGHITHIAMSGGGGESFTYDALGNLTSSTDANGNKKGYAYYAKHRMSAVTDPLGRKTLYHYDASGRVTGVTDALGNRTSYAYDSVNHTTTVTSPEGRRVVLTYDQGELVDVSAGPGAPPLAEWTLAYDAKTLALTRTVDPNLNVTTSAVNANGLRVRATDSLGNTATAAYSDTGRWSSMTDPAGVTTKLTYDENGNVLTQSTPVTSSGTKQMQRFAWAYDDPAHPGDMTSSIDAVGNETDYTYDSRGNPASVTDPLGKTWTFSKGWPCRWELSADSVTDPLGHTTTATCDKNGNLLTTTDGTGATTTNTYDAADELVSTTDPAGRKTTYSYNADGQLSAVHMPDGTASSATYGADGELLTTVDPAGGTQSFTYDALGRVTSSTDQLGRTTTNAYDAAGNITSTTDAMGVMASNTYDGDNRVLSTSYSDGATPPVSYAYDANGRRTSMTDGTGMTAYQYDSLDRLIQTVDGSGASVVSGYDLSGDRTSLQYPNGHTVAMQYDANGQMTAVTDWLGHTTQLSYDGAGNEIASHVVGGKTTTWAYDAANRKVHGVHHGENGIAYASFDYTRAVDGRITAVDSTGLSSGPQSYSYDGNGRLGAENATPVSFDSRNNVTGLPDGSTLSYDAADQLVSRLAGGLSTSYTVNGDGERTGSSSSAQSLSYAWSVAGDLTSFTGNGATTSYVVNGDGRRMSSSGGGVTHTFAWDPTPSPGACFGKGIIRVPSPPIGTACGIQDEEFIPARAGLGNGSAGLILSDGTNSYVYGPGGMPIEQIDNAGNALFLDADAQGSVRVLTDAAGNVQGTASFDAFGNEIAHSGAVSPFGFDGMYSDAESGLYAMSVGVYDPATGQNLTTRGRSHDAQVVTPFLTWAPATGQNLAQSKDSNDCVARCKLNVCGDGLATSNDCVARCKLNVCGDGLSAPTLTPYGVPGGDPVNAVVVRPGDVAAGDPSNDQNDVNR